MGYLKYFINELIYGNRITAVIRILLGLIFLYSGLLKIVDPSGFARVIALYDILPGLLIPYAALFVPGIEITAGLLLFIGFKTRSAALTLIFLISVFTIAITVNVIRGKSFDCGCLDLEALGISEDIGISLIIRNIIIFLAFLLVSKVNRFAWSIDEIIENKQLKETV